MHYTAYKAELPTGSIFLWVKRWIHPVVHGCVPDQEISDVSWDARADCEHAMMTKENIVVILVRLLKFYDAFGPECVRRFAIALGINEDLAESAANLYKKTIRFF